MSQAKEIDLIEKGAHDFLAYLATRFSQADSQVHDAEGTFETKLKQIQDRLTADEVKQKAKDEETGKMIAKTIANLGADIKSGKEVAEKKAAALETQFKKDLKEESANLKKMIARGSADLQEKIDSEQDAQIKRLEDQVSSMKKLIMENRQAVESVVHGTKKALEDDIGTRHAAHAENVTKTASTLKNDFEDSLSKLHKSMKKDVGSLGEQNQAQIRKLEEQIAVLGRQLSLETNHRVSLQEELREHREQSSLENQQLRDVVANVQRDIGHLHDLVTELRRITQLLHQQIVELKAARPRYMPLEGDLVDELVAETVNRHRNDPAYCIPMERTAEGQYRFGTRQISICLLDGAVAVRVGGGFMAFEEFVDRYSAMESIKLRKKDGSTLERPLARSSSAGGVPRSNSRGKLQQ